MLKKSMVRFLFTFCVNLSVFQIIRNNQVASSKYLLHSNVTKSVISITTIYLPMTFTLSKIVAVATRGILCLSISTIKVD